MFVDGPERPLQERLQALADFLPIFEQPGFKIGEWSGVVERRDGVIVIPRFYQNDTADSFVRMTYDMGWVREDVGWGSWMGTDEAKRLRDDPEALAAATPDQLVRLLTVLIRQNRYVDGALESAFKTGLLTGICRRAAAMVRAPD